MSSTSKLTKNCKQIARRHVKRSIKLTKINYDMPKFTIGITFFCSHEIQAEGERKDSLAFFTTVIESEIFDAKLTIKGFKSRNFLIARPAHQKLKHTTNFEL